MVNKLHLYSILSTPPSALQYMPTFTHSHTHRGCHANLLIRSDTALQSKATHAMCLYSPIHTHSHTDGTDIGSNFEFSIAPKDTSIFGLEEPGIKPLTWLVLPPEPQPPTRMFDMITVCIISSIVGVNTIGYVEIDSKYRTGEKKQIVTLHISI